MQKPVTTGNFNPAPTAQARRPLLKRATLAAAVLAASFVQASSLSLSWNDNSLSEDGFEVQRARPGQSFEVVSVLGPDQSAFVDSSVIPGLEYEYRVRAFNAFGYSGFTNVSAGLVANTAPTVSPISDVAALKGDSLPEIAFEFSDAESPSGSLVVEALSSNPSLLPLESLSLEIGEGSGKLSLPSSYATSGSSEITLLVSDGVEVARRTFLVEILRNLAPTIGTLAEASAFDGQTVGPIDFTISDAELDSDSLQVTASSLDETLVPSHGIRLGGSGDGREVSFETLSDVSGSATIRLTVSDGVNETHGALRVSIARNRAPEIDGLEGLYTLDGGGNLSGLGFSVSDHETSAGSLEVRVTSSNENVVSNLGIRLGGSGSQRTLDVSPNAGAAGSAQVTVSVSDGIKTSSQSFTLRILSEEAIVRILGFEVVERLAVVEVENLPGSELSLWKIHTRGGAWEKVEGAEVVADAGSTTLIDPSPIDSAVCYRVVASL